MSNDSSADDGNKNIDRVKHYADGAALIFANAEALYDEAQMLGEAGHFARATVLHQISMEECSKIDNLGAAATSLLVGFDVDEKRLARAFRNHRAKNYANAYFAKTTDEELAARKQGDWKASGEAFKKFQDKFHDEVNTIKNAGLYVDFEDGQFNAPADQIDEAVAIAFQMVNASFLKRCDTFLRLLKRMVEKPDLYTDLTNEFLAKAKELRAAKKLDPQQIEDNLMNDLIKNYASKMTEKDGSEEDK